MVVLKNMTYADSGFPAQLYRCYIIIGSRHRYIYFPALIFLAAAGMFNNTLPAYILHYWNILFNSRRYGLDCDQREAPEISLYRQPCSLWLGFGLLVSCIQRFDHSTHLWKNIIRPKENERCNPVRVHACIYRHTGYACGGSTGYALFGVIFAAVSITSPYHQDLLPYREVLRQVSSIKRYFKFTDIHYR